jgi:hypothetical protein
MSNLALKVLTTQQRVVKTLSDLPLTTPRWPAVRSSGDGRSIASQTRDLRAWRAESISVAPSA